jgi:hypothetical protein
LCYLLSTVVATDDDELNRRKREAYLQYDTATAPESE